MYLMCKFNFLYIIDYWGDVVFIKLGIYFWIVVSIVVCLIVVICVKLIKICFIIINVSCGLVSWFDVK